MQQFVSASAWDEGAVGRRYRALMAGSFADAAGVFVLDDTTFPKAGVHSVGVQRQYCGALGKKANCQAAVSLHYVAPAGHVPLGLRLFLPEAWLESPVRLDQAGVPESERRALSKGEIALELLDAVHAEGVLPGQVVVGDSGYGVSGPFRAGLALRTRRDRGEGRLFGRAALAGTGSRPPRPAPPSPPLGSRQPAAFESTRGGCTHPATQSHLGRDHAQ